MCGIMIVGDRKNCDGRENIGGSISIVSWLTGGQTSYIKSLNQVSLPNAKAHLLMLVAHSTLKSKDIIRQIWM